MYVYRQIPDGRGPYHVGVYLPDGTGYYFHIESSWESYNDAAARVNYLNGGNGQKINAVCKVGPSWNRT